MSLPLWERGLKSIYEVLVTSLDSVAPLVGAWIEILLTERPVKYHMSLPLWERGLKYRYINTICLTLGVAPLVGAWIEIDTRIYQQRR